MEKYLKPLSIKIYIYIGYASSEPEHMKQKEIIKWLRSNARDMSFDGLCDDIIHGQAIVPYQLCNEGIDYSVKWNKGLDFTDLKLKRKIHLSRVRFAHIWNMIRQQGIVTIEGNDEGMVLMLRLLENLGYLSPIRILDDQGISMKKGYQVNEGYGRMFSLSGEIA